MSDSLSTIYGLILDLAAIGSFTIKPFSIFIIIYYTPKHLRITSYFILNEMIWNLAGNLLFTLGHPYPLLPAQCIRLDGIIAQFISSETIRHIFFLLILVTAVNCNIGLLTTFQFRYMAIAWKDIRTRVHVAWGYVYCILLHVICTAIFCYLQYNMRTTVEEYSQLDHLEHTNNVFCFKPSGWEKRLLMWSFFFSMIGFAATLLVFTLLCYAEFRKQEGQLEKKTLEMQRRVMRNLVIMTAVPVVLACFPLFMASLFIQFNEWPYAREVAAVSYMLVSNHGTVYSVLTLLLFQSYRRAAKTILDKCSSVVLRVVLKRKSPVVMTTKVMTIGYSSRRI
uniref:G_PROTEIN_RECEP_F1_2 domain-containing protein n=1 Tax=Steinernema glaseri TaxID=37863 RepID=A0A1I7ZYV2_9BILA